MMSSINKIRINNVDYDLQTPEVYSEQEQIVGTWINEEPIYRKVFELTDLDVGETRIAHNIQNLSQIISARGAFQRMDGKREILDRVDQSTSWEVNIGDISDDTITISAGTSYTNDFKIVQLHLILEYTKVENTATEG